MAPRNGGAMHRVGSPHPSPTLGVPLEGLLQPTTDAGVAAQAIVAALLVAALAWRVRRDADLLRLVLGGGTLLAGLFVLRAMH